MIGIGLNFSRKILSDAPSVWTKSARPMVGQPPRLTTTNERRKSRANPYQARFRCPQQINKRVDVTLKITNSTAFGTVLEKLFGTILVVEMPNAV